MWSYRRDLGPVRMLVIDSRCGRILADGRRSMVSDAEFEWLEHQVDDGGFEHLVVVTSHALAAAAGAPRHRVVERGAVRRSRGAGCAARTGEWVRRAVDLEHWAAFRKSFDRLAALFERVGRGEHGAPRPPTICVLSGDVHHSYVAEADYQPELAAASTRSPARRSTTRSILS